MQGFSNPSSSSCGSSVSSMLVELAHWSMVITATVTTKMQPLSTEAAPDIGTGNGVGVWPVQPDGMTPACFVCVWRYHGFPASLESLSPWNQNEPEVSPTLVA